MLATQKKIMWTISALAIGGIVAAPIMTGMSVSEPVKTYILYLDCMVIFLCFFLLFLAPKKDNYKIFLKDFSYYPGSKYRGSNESSEAFRKIVIQAMIDHDDVIIDLDGTVGIGMDFLNEVFGGLISKEGLNKEYVRKHVKVISADNSYMINVETAIDNAKAR